MRGHFSFIKQLFINNYYILGLEHLEPEQNDIPVYALSIIEPYV